MGTFSIWHWVIVLVVVLVLFGGRGKISSLMGDIGKGLKSFKKNVKDDDEPKDPKVIEGDGSAMQTDAAPQSDANKTVKN